MAQKQQQNPDFSFSENYRLAQIAMEYPAITVLPYLCKNLGYRLMSPLRLLALTVFLVVVSTLAIPGSNATTNPRFLLYFALVSFVLGIIARIKAWWSLNRGVRQHSYYIGDARCLRFSWVPDFFRRHRRAEKILNPAICLGAGMAFYPISHALSAWLFLSAVSIRYVEYAIQLKFLNSDLDTLDSMITAERQGQVIEQFQNPSGVWQKPPSAGVNTGIGPDIEGQVSHKPKHNPDLN